MTQTGPVVRDQHATVALGATVAAFLGLALLVAPVFLDYAQEAKTYCLTLLTLATAVLGLWPGRTRALLLAHLFAVPRAFWWLTLGLLVSVGVASSNATAALPSVLYGLRTLLLPLLAAFLLSPLLDPKRTMAALAVSSAAVAALGLLQVLLHLTYLTPLGDAGQFPAVTFGNRGLASTFVGLGLVPTIFVRQLGGEGWRRRGCDLALLLQVLFVLVAMTRSCVLASFGALTLYAIATLRTRRHQVVRKRLLPVIVLYGLGLCAVLGFVTILIFSSDQLALLLRQRLDPHNWLHNPRIELWYLSLNAWLEQDWRIWIFGFGPGAFADHVSRWTQGSPIATLKFYQAHNDAVQGLLEYGIASTTLWLLLASTRYLGRRNRPGPQWFAPMVGFYAVNSMFFYTLQIPFFTFIFWLLILLRVRGAVRSEHRPVAGGSKRLVMALLVASILLLGSESVVRPLVETQMHALLREPAPYPEKLARKSALLDTLRYLPSPPIYRELVEHFGARAAFLSP